MKPHVLLVDDEEPITSGLTPVLARAGFEVSTARDGEEALAQIEKLKPDVVVLDILMPKLDGREVCRRLREQGNWLPIIMLTQVNATGEKIMSFEEGADDYLSKPFDSYELIARINSLLRRVKRPAADVTTSETLISGDLIVNRRSQRVKLAGKDIDLSPKAYQVLDYLISSPGEVVTREQLLNTIWGWSWIGGTRTVDVRVAELRRKLGDNASDPHFIETVIGEGYRFIGPVEAGK